jgi:hypothetical protein
VPNLHLVLPLALQSCFAAGPQEAAGSDNRTDLLYSELSNCVFHDKLLFPLPFVCCILQMAAGFRKVRKYFDMLDLNGDRVIDMREFTSQVGASYDSAMHA